jgi:glycosidase
MTAPRVEAGLRFSGGDADVWAWNRQVRGILENPETCQALWIEHHGNRSQVTIEGKSFSASIPVQEGSNNLIAVCQHPDAQEEVSPMVTYTGRLRQSPTAIITASLADGRLQLDGKASQPDEVENQPIREYLWSPRPGNPAIASASSAAAQGEHEFVEGLSARRIEVNLPRIDGVYSFTLRVVDEAGREDASTIFAAVEQGQARLPDYDVENPAWVERAVVYGVIPRLFGTPGARAIQEKLDYLADLGVNALWLAPVNATIDYGYSVIDYFELRENFGTKDDLRKLVQSAHDLGIRVLMDFVPNHSSEKHPYFQDTLANGPESPYWDYYDRDERGDYTYYFNWTHLPNLNYENPEVWRWMIEAFSYWVREFDMDGFRVDAAWGVKERRPDFWPEWRRELKRIRPDLLLLAEASARDPYYFDNGFDAAYDWTDQLGKWAWGPFWAEDAPKADRERLTDSLRTALTNPPSGYHPDALIFRFLNNNDTGTRFITTHGPGVTRVATAMLLTLPGIPCIYTGDEVGAWFRPYYDPAPISWEERYPGLLDYHKQLIGLRKELPSLRSRLWKPLVFDPVLPEGFGYLRYTDAGDPPVIVLLNFEDRPVDMVFDLPEEYRSIARHGNLYDLLSGDHLRTDGLTQLRVTLPGTTARILAGEPVTGSMSEE